MIGYMLLYPFESTSLQDAKEARSARQDSNLGKAGLQPTAVTAVPRAHVSTWHGALLKILTQENTCLLDTQH